MFPRSTFSQMAAALVPPNSAVTCLPSSVAQRPGGRSRCLVHACRACATQTQMFAVDSQQCNEYKCGVPFSELRSEIVPFRDLSFAAAEVPCRTALLCRAGEPNTDGGAARRSTA